MTFQRWTARRGRFAAPDETRQTNGGENRETKTKNASFARRLAMAGMACLCAASAEAAVIDDFSDPGGYPPTLLVGPAPQSFSHSGPAATISGNRSVDVALTGGGGAATLTSTIAAGSFNYFLGGAGSEGTFSLEYAGGLLPADFTGMGNSIFTVDLASADSAAVGTVFTMLLQDVSSIADSVDVTLAVSGPQTLFFDFAGTAVDLSAVDFIQFSGVVPVDGDIQISEINGPTVVPEPSSVVLWGLMGLGLLAYRRRTVLKESTKSLSQNPCRTGL